MRLAAVSVALLLVVAGPPAGGAARAAPPAPPAADRAGELDAERFAAHCRALTADPHRLAGTAADERAAAYLETQLRAISDQVYVHHFSFPQQIVHACELRLPNGDVVALEPLAANGAQPSITPPEGMAGELLYVGKGAREDLSGLNLEGRLVLADFASKGVIERVFRLGARAVIFVGDDVNDRRYAKWKRDEPSLGEYKRSHVTIDLPRFYISRQRAQAHGLLAGGEGTLVSQVRWERRWGRNLYLWVPGTQPDLGRTDGSPPEYVILSAPYDSKGIVPTNSRSPETAANCAALLETARLLAAAPPRRSVLIAFFDNHANFLEGGRHFYTSLRRAYAEGIKDPLPLRRQFVRDERAFLHALLRFLTRVDLFAGDTARSVDLRAIRASL